MLAARPLIVVPLNTATVVSARLVDDPPPPPPLAVALSVGAAVGVAAWLGVVGVSSPPISCVAA